MIFYNILFSSLETNYFFWVIALALDPAVADINIYLINTYMGNK